MIYGNRDIGIDYIRTRKNHTCYGMGIGIMVLDDAYPGFPGDVRNASAFPYPVQYEIAEGVDNHTLVWAPDKTPCREPILRAAARLERMGCRAIAAECGYFAYFQKDVARHVSIPVFMSSLLQVPFIQLGHPSRLCLFHCGAPGLLRSRLAAGPLRCNESFTYQPAVDIFSMTRPKRRMAGVASSDQLAAFRRMKLP